MKKEVSVVIVSFNTASILRACILSLLQYMPQSIVYEIIVVDNNSRDDTVSMIKREFSDVVLIQNKENLGFSKANNMGIHVAQGNYILFLNPDTEFIQGGFSKLLTYLDKNNDVGALTGKVRLPDGQLDDACHRGFPTPWNSFCHFSGLSKLFPHSKIFAGYTLGWMDLNKIHQIDACSGAFMLVRYSTGLKLQWWDEDFFWYGEDLDFCYRLKENHWKLIFVPEFEILHLKGVSGGLKTISKHVTTADKSTKIRATNARFEAMRIFYKKHYLNTYPIFITWLVMQGIAFKLRLSKRKI